MRSRRKDRVAAAFTAAADRHAGTVIRGKSWWSPPNSACLSRACIPSICVMIATVLDGKGLRDELMRQVVGFLLTVLLSPLFRWSLSSAVLAGVGWWVWEHGASLTPIEP